MKRHEPQHTIVQCVVSFCLPFPLVSGLQCGITSVYCSTQIDTLNIYVAEVIKDYCQVMPLYKV